MSTLRHEMQAFAQRLTEHGQRLNQANCILQRRVLEASLRKHPTAPAPAAPTPEEREAHYRQECERRGVQYVPLPADQEADDR